MVCVHLFEVTCAAWTPTFWNIVYFRKDTALNLWSVSLGKKIEDFDYTLASKAVTEVVPKKKLYWKSIVVSNNYNWNRYVLNSRSEFFLSKSLKTAYAGEKF